MLLEVGSMYRITEDCFDVESDVNQKSSNHSSAKQSGGGGMELSKSTSSLHAAASKVSAKAMSKPARGVASAGIHEEIYKIHMVFEKPTQYMAIPFDAFKSAIKSISISESKGK